MDHHRVVITGIGLVTPLGSDRETSWARYCAGESGLRWLPGGSRPDEAALWPERSAGGPAPFDETLPDTLADRGRGDLVPLLAEPVISLALSAAIEAVADAGLDSASLPHDRAASVIRTSKGRIHVALLERSGSSIRSYALTDTISRSCGRYNAQRSGTQAVSSLFETRVGAIAPVAACATGLVSLIRAAELIQSGLCDVVLAGSADASLTPAIVASFRRLGVLARNFDDPATAIRPCNETRDGFLIGEGAAVFVPRIRQARLDGTRNRMPSGLPADSRPTPPD